VPYFFVPGKIKYAISSANPKQTTPTWEELQCGTFCSTLGFL
jgi:hypothetical protein